MAVGLGAVSVAASAASAAVAVERPTGLDRRMGVPTAQGGGVVLQGSQTRRAVGESRGDRGCCPWRPPPGNGVSLGPLAFDKTNLPVTDISSD